MQQLPYNRRLRGAIGRGKKMHWKETILPAQPARQFKTDQRPHAMPEKRKRDSTKWMQRLDKGFQQGLKLIKRRLFQAILTPWKLNRQDFDFRLQSVQPCAINRRAAPGIGETEQAKAGLLVGPCPKNPGSCSCCR